MNGYADLPKLVPVMDRILGYLSVKQRVRCKGVCRAWREEIELKDQKSDTLVLHLGPYRLNMRWTETNNRRLMKFENSFEMKNLNILKHLLTREQLKKTKKLAIVDFHGLFDPEAKSIQPYLSYFDQCEEIEIRNLRIEGRQIFDLPKLKVLVLNDSPIDMLVLNCPSLEVLFWNQEVYEIHFQNAKKLKRLICFGWPVTVSLKGKFSSLASLNLFVARDERVNDRLLDLMPNLKRLVLYSRNLQADLKIIREQQKRCGLENLEVLFNGFRDPVRIELNSSEGKFLIAGWCVEQLHENYSKLVENLPWKVCIEYSTLFRKFKILPSNFFERFSEPCAIEIAEVTNYTHLLGFLKCYPFFDQLIIDFYKVNADRILDLAYSLQPSLNELVILDKCPWHVRKIDLSFMRFFNLAILQLRSTRVPAEFLRKVVANKGPHFVGFIFRKITTGHQMLISFSGGIVLHDVTCKSETAAFPSVELLIAHMQSDRHLREFLL